MYLLILTMATSKTDTAEFEEATFLRELSFMVQEDTIPLPLLIEETIRILQAIRMNSMIWSLKGIGIGYMNMCLKMKDPGNLPNLRRSR